MENFETIYKNEKEWICSLGDTYTMEYTIEFFDGIAGTRDLEIYDNTGSIINPNEFMICTTDGFRAVNLSQDDVKRFLKAVINHTVEKSRR
jgi:hypothetical protein|nr:MAG TPA: hypothetical protein [Caudoviricetes sp.]